MSSPRQVTRRAPISLPDRYSAAQFVAAGGMASVWAARDELLARDVAVKVLAEHVAADAGARRRFQREARMAASLSSHPHVVTIYDVGEHDGRAFIVMELFRGGTVGDVLRDGTRVRRDLVLRWLSETASALDAAHASGVVHRDVKPGNLLLDERGRLAVADFGIARLAGDEQMTQTGVVLGTAAYLSPEQATGKPASPASDRYSLAVVAFELLTGRKPFNGEHFAAQARQHVEDPPPPASSIEPSLPAAVDAVLARGLAKDPAARWATAAEFVSRLEQAFDAPDQQRALPPTAATAVAPHRREPATPRPVAAERPRRRPLGFLLLGLVALVVALLVAILVPALDRDDTGTRGQGRTTTSDEPSRSATPTPGEKTEETAQTATPSPEATATEPPAQQPSGDSAASLNDRGYELYQQGKYAEAVPLLRQAVDKCGDSRELDPCGYALFNLGSALHRSGKSAEAIPYLERRLAGWDFKQGEVQAELDAAREAAGQGGEGGGGDTGKKPKKNK